MSRPDPPPPPSPPSGLRTGMDLPFPMESVDLEQSSLAPAEVLLSEAHDPTLSVSSHKFSAAFGEEQVVPKLFDLLGIVTGIQSSVVQVCVVLVCCAFCTGWGLAVLSPFSPFSLSLVALTSHSFSLSFSPSSPSSPISTTLWVPISSFIVHGCGMHNERRKLCRLP